MRIIILLERNRPPGQKVNFGKMIRAIRTTSQGVPVYLATQKEEHWRVALENALDGVIERLQAEDGTSSPE